MNKKQLFSLMILFLFCVQLSAQEESNFSISPYGGLSNSLGDSKDFLKPGSVFGVDGTYQLSKTFGLAADINFASLKFDDAFNIDGLPSGYLQNNIGNEKWKKNTFSIGPVFKLPLKRTNISIYALGGISSVEIPEIKGNVTGGFLNMLENFHVEEQKSTGFGLNVGMKIGFNLSDRIVLPNYIVHFNA